MRVLMFMVVLTMSCRQPTTPPAASAPAPTENWMHRAGALIQSGQCAEALQYLESLAQTEREPLYYELLSSAHVTCWRKSQKTEDASRAIAAIDEGLQRYPQSANLLLSRGYRHRDFGEHNLALQDFKAAVAMARSTAGGAAADETVAKAAAQAIADLSDASRGIPVLEQEILTLLASGKCLDALRRLDGEAQRPDAWYDLRYMANSLCLNSTGEEAYRKAAEAALRDGLRQFPHSVRLLIQSGAWNETIGNRKAAAEYYSRALREPSLDTEYEGGKKAIEERLKHVQ